VQSVLNQLIIIGGDYASPRGADEVLHATEHPRLLLLGRRTEDVGIELEPYRFVELAVGHQASERFGRVRELALSDRRLALLEPIRAFSEGIAGIREHLPEQAVPARHAAGHREPSAHEGHALPGPKPFAEISRQAEGLRHQ